MQQPAPPTQSTDAEGSALFTQPAYLEPLSRYGCASPENGWTPIPLRIDGIGHAPCYLKTHSWGEFVFDFQIARVYEQNGLDYYPKLVGCVPFTPVPGPRLLAADVAGRMALADAMLAQTETLGASSAHLLYLPAEDVAPLRERGWLHRTQLRYLWRNHGYASFDDFLGALNAKRRKNIRAERRVLGDRGIDIRWADGSHFDDRTWRHLYALYARTYAIRGQSPYLTLECLQAWAQAYGERMPFCLASVGDDIIAMAFFFEDDNGLYGRHWGAAADYDKLHFELCYYQGIERCIAQGLRHFDAGVQGEHKLLRGFEPVTAHSMHHFRHPALHDAIGRYFTQERSALAEERDALHIHSRLRVPG